MAKPEPLTLTPEEARGIAFELLDSNQGTRDGFYGLNSQQAMRLLVKLDRCLAGVSDYGTMFGNLPAWARAVLHDAYAPLPKAPAKKAPAKASSRKRVRAGKAAAPARTTSSVAARAAEEPAPFPSPRVRDAASAAPGAESPTGSSSAGGDADVKLTPSAARRLGGLSRARQAAFARGDNVRVSELDRRIADLHRQAAAVDAHS